MTTDVKKYNYMENSINTIMKKCISLDAAEMKKQREILRDLLDQVILELKKKQLFNRIFERVFFGGSFYDDLRVQNPNEFDLDLLFRLPTYAQPELVISNAPGFVHCKLNNFDAFMKQPEGTAYYKEFEKDFLDSKHFLDACKLRMWMESIVTRALNAFPQNPNGSGRVLKISGHGKFIVVVKKAGPALTLNVQNLNKELVMDVDLVPCFVFKADKWPKKPFIANPVKLRPDFFIVPKSPKTLGATDNIHSHRYWRLSFQEQERELMAVGKTFKPTIKLLKTLRDKFNHACISSYFIKTVVLQIAKDKNKEFWNKSSLSLAFMVVFKSYIEFLENKKIPYYWNSSNNLIRHIKPQTLTDISNALNNIYNDIERNLGDPKVIEKYFMKK